MTPKSRLEEIKARLTVAKRDIDRYSDELSHNTFKDIAWLIFEVERLQKNILDKSFWESGPLALKVEDLEAKLQRQDEMLKELGEASELLSKEIGGLMSAHRVVLGYDHGNSNCAAVDARVATLNNLLKELRGRDSE